MKVYHLLSLFCCNSRCSFDGFKRLPSTCLANKRMSHSCAFSRVLAMVVLEQSSVEEIPTFQGSGVQWEQLAVRKVFSRSEGAKIYPIQQITELFHVESSLIHETPRLRRKKYPWEEVFAVDVLRTPGPFSDHFVAKESWTGSMTEKSFLLRG